MGMPFLELLLPVRSTRLFAVVMVAMAMMMTDTDVTLIGFLSTPIIFAGAAIAIADTKAQARISVERIRLAAARQRAEIEPKLEEDIEDLEDVIERALNHLEEGSIKACRHELERAIGL